MMIENQKQVILDEKISPVEQSYMFHKFEKRGFTQVRSSDLWENTSIARVKLVNRQGTWETCTVKNQKG